MKALIGLVGQAGEVWAAAVATPRLIAAAMIAKRRLRTISFPISLGSLFLAGTLPRTPCTVALPLAGEGWGGSTSDSRQPPRLPLASPSPTLPRKRGREEQFLLRSHRLGLRLQHEIVGDGVVPGVDAIAIGRDARRVFDEIDDQRRLHAVNHIGFDIRAAAPE